MEERLTYCAYIAEQLKFALDRTREVEKYKSQMEALMTEGLCVIAEIGRGRGTLTEARSKQVAELGTKINWSFRE